MENDFRSLLREENGKLFRVSTIVEREQGSEAHVVVKTIGVVVETERQFEKVNGNTVVERKAETMCPAKGYPRVPI